jgi:hypothetical protein
MNHIYRSIWSPAAGTCVATSEHVAGLGKTTSTAANKRSVDSGQRAWGPFDGVQMRRAGSTCGRWPVALMLAWGGLAMANPTGGLVSAGQAAKAAVPGSPYAIVPSSATGGTFTPSNYSISYVNGVLTVTPAPLTITAQDVSKVYGQAPALTGFDASALVNGETVGSVTLTSAGQAANAAVPGSPYAIVPSSATGGSFTPSNYSISYVSGVLTVTPAPVVPPEVPPPVVVVPAEPPIQVEPEVVVPPVQPPIVVEPEVVAPVPEQPVVALPEVPSTETPVITPPVQEALSPSGERQALPKVPGRDRGVVLLRVLPGKVPVQGPVTLAATIVPEPLPAPEPVPVDKPLATEPMPAVQSLTPMPAPVPAAQPAVKRMLPPLLPRRPKQDRN